MKAGLFSFISRAADGSTGLSRHARPLLDRLFARWIPPRPEESQGWAADANWAQLDQEPLRARYLLRSIVVILIALLLWAAFATVDEVTRGSGKVIPTRQIQIVQAVDGGVVAEILVREGQMVEAGQSLFRIDETRFVSSLRENRVQYLALLAKAARLRALAENTPFQLPPEIAKEDPGLVEEERSMYNARRSELEAQLSIARQQLAQRNQELVEVRSRQAQAAQGYELTARELAMTKPLAASGAVSDVELLRLERDVCLPLEALERLARDGLAREVVAGERLGVLGRERRFDAGAVLHGVAASIDGPRLERVFTRRAPHDAARE